MSALNKIDPLFNTLLNQGKNFLNIQNNYKHMVDPHLNLIEQTTSPGLGSIIENFSQNSPSPPPNFVDKTNTVASEIAAINNDQANTAALQQFTNLINNYNTTYKKYESIPLAPNMPASQLQSNSPKANARNTMINNLITLNTMISKKLSGRTSGGTQGYDYQAGSGEAGAGDHPQLLAQRARILGPIQTALSDQRTLYDTHVNHVNTLIGEVSDTEIRSKSAYYKYIVWTIVSITLIGYTIKYATP